MGKSTKKKNKKVTAPKANIQELSISRDGGQIALRGYSYQFLYSCYLILSSSNPSNFFQIEGIEDIDCIMQKNGSNDITHIQLKYSVNKQDASFLTDVLKNFLEAYLLDQNRFFKLVYDFPVAKGHLSKIFVSKLDEKSRTHWAGVISNIKKNNPSWNWSVYDFDKFISHAPFDYLVILSANESEEIDSTALQFPRRMLVDVKKAIESENHSLLVMGDESIQKFVHCFQSVYLTGKEKMRN